MLQLVHFLSKDQQVVQKKKKLKVRDPKKDIRKAIYGIC